MIVPSPRDFPLVPACLWERPRASYGTGIPAEIVRRVIWGNLRSRAAESHHPARVTEGKSDLELPDYGIKRNVDPALLRVVGLDRQLSTQLAIRRAAPKRHRNAIFPARLHLVSRSDHRRRRAGDVEYLHVSGAGIGEPQNPDDVLAFGNDAK